MTPSPFSRLASGAVSGLLSGLAQTIAGIKTFTSVIIASAGVQTASVFSTNGAGAGDVVLKVGTTAADASVNAAAKLWALYTGLGGTEVLKAYFDKAGSLHFTTNDWTLKADGSGFWFYVGATPYMFINVGTGVVSSGYGLQVTPLFGAYNSFQVPTSGLVNQRGTDSTGTPGAATIDRPIGKSSIAAAASSVVITNNLVTALSHIIITPMENATNNAEFRNFKVTPTAGSFTVTVNAATTVAWPFAWRVATILTA
jgi:hypothetical protein